MSRKLGEKIFNINHAKRIPLPLVLQYPVKCSVWWNCSGGEKGIDAYVVVVSLEQNKKSRKLDEKIFRVRHTKRVQSSFRIVNGIQTTYL